MGQIADDIFVGSVSVGVVPDLRGFNSRLRSELVPAANEIGKSMGREIQRGLRETFDMGKIVTEAIKTAKPAGYAMGVAIGKEVTKGVADTFFIGKIIVEATKNARPAARLSGADLGAVYGSAFRKSFDDALKGIHAKVDVDINKASLARAKTEVRDALKDVRAGLGISGLVPGGGAGGGRTATSAGGGGIIGGIGALIRALPGGTSGSFGAVPPQVLVPAGVGAAASLPFIAQILGGGVTSLLGGGLAALGIAGAVGTGKQGSSKDLAKDQQALAIANQRVTAAQQRLNELQNKGGASASSLASANASVASAQDHLNKLQGSGTASALSLQAAQLRLTAAEGRLKTLRQGGQATASSLTSAEATLAAARQRAADARSKLDQAEKTSLTQGQERVRKSFTDLATNAIGSLSKIGVSFIPVMESIAGTAQSVLDNLTPVFAGAVKTISGPFQEVANVVLSSFTDPQVTSAIQAVSRAFADILTAFAPDIPGIINSFADAIERIAQSVSKNPKAFADFLNFLFQVGIAIVNAIAFLTDFADWVEKHWNIIGWFVSPLIMVITHWQRFSTIMKGILHDIAHAFDVFRHGVATQWDLFWQDTAGRAIRAQRHLQQLISDWLHNIAHWFDVARHEIAHIWDLMWQATVGAAIRQQRHLQQLISSWLHNMAHWFDVARHDVAAAWDSMWSHLYDWALKGWGKIYNNVWAPVRDFFTKTLPGWFDTATKAVGKVWDNIKAKIATPIRWVAQHILIHLFNAIDDITNFVSGKKPLQNTVDALTAIPAMARGGRLPGYGGGDQHPALLEAGETVVSKEHSRQLADIFRAVGVPGYSAGGPVTGPMPTDLGTGLGPGLAQMTGWFGGLGDASRIAAVNFAGVRIFINKFVAATVAQIGNEIGAAYPGYINSTTGGWRTQVGASTSHIPYSMHQLGLAIDINPDTNPYLGNNGSILSHPKIIDIFKKHGWFWGGNWGPGGRDQMHFQLEFPSGQQGGLGVLGGVFRTIGDILGGVGKFAGIAISLAKGDLGGAIGKLLGSTVHGAGGAAGDFSKLLLAIPGKLVGLVLGNIMGTVKNFVSNQQQSSGVPGVPAAHGSALAAQKFAKARLAQFGWGPDQFPSLLALWQGESGWNANAVNPSSGAYGIPQALGHGHPFNLGDYANQIIWGLNYIKSVYGSPSAAYSKWQGRSPHWYARGTDGAAAGWGVVGEYGPEFVRFHGGETVLPHGVIPGYATGTEQLLRAERQRDVIQLQILQNSLRLAGTALARAHYQAMIKVELARIAVIDENLRKLASVNSTAINKLAATQIRAFQNAGATLAARLAKVTPATTAATFASNQALFLKDLRLYFSPSVAYARSLQVIRQTNQLKTLQTEITKLAGNVKMATDFQKQELQHLQAYGGITQIGLQGVGAEQGQTLLTGLNTQVNVLRNFGSTLQGLQRAGASTDVLKQVAGMDPAAGTDYGRKMITALNKMKALHLPAGMMAQLIASGPDAAIAYSDALKAAGPTTLSQIISAETRLEAARLAVSRGAASVVAGGAYVTGANFVAGLKSQQKHLETLFAHLGRTMGQEAIKWMRVPANKRPFGYQHGGWINEPIAGFGLYSGASYTFAERGREYVIPEGSSMRGGDGATQYHAHFDGLTGAAIESHVQTAFMAMSLTQGALSRQGRRSL